MEKVEEFHIAYWSRDELTYPTSKKQRSIKKKLSIVFTFILVLGMLPLLSVGYGYYRNHNAGKSSTARASIQTPLAEAKTKATPVPTQAQSNTDYIIKGDSYWRISKRNCGTGKAYLTIQNLNAGKPLHAGDIVSISCFF